MPVVSVVVVNSCRVVDGQSELPDFSQIVVQLVPPSALYSYLMIESNSAGWSQDRMIVRETPVPITTSLPPVVSRSSHESVRSLFGPVQERWARPSRALAARLVGLAGTLSGSGVAEPPLRPRRCRPA